MSKPVYRLAKQNAHCRSCDKELVRLVDKMVTMHSFRNRGQNIHLCKECVLEMAEMVNESND